MYFFLQTILFFYVQINLHLSIIFQGKYSANSSSCLRGEMKRPLQLEEQVLCGLPEAVQRRVIREPQRVWEQNNLCYFSTVCWMEGPSTSIMDYSLAGSRQNQPKWDVFTSRVLDLWWLDREDWVWPTWTAYEKCLQPLCTDTIHGLKNIFHSKSFPHIYLK